MVSKGAAIVGSLGLGLGLFLDNWERSKIQKEEFAQKQKMESEELSLAVSKQRLAYLAGGVNITGTALLQEEYLLDNLFTAQRLARKALNYRTISQNLGTSLRGVTELYRLYNSN